MASKLVPEIIIQILKNFETVEEVVVCASACRRFHDVWLCHAPQIIWSIAQKQILALDDALMAVRATEIVLESFQKEELPPDPFPLSTLSGAVRRPSLREFRQVRDFEHLAKCAEQIYVGDEEDLKNEIQRDQSDGAALWVLWRERFHSSIYRVLLAGAVLYRAYQEPMYFAANWGLPNFLEKYVEALASDDMSSEPVGGDELDYLMTFAPYKLGEGGGIHGSFKALGEFLVQQGKKRAHQFNLHEQTTEILPPFAAPQGLSSSEAAVVFVELGQLLFALEVLTGIQDRQPIIVNGNGSEEHGRPELPRIFSTSLPERLLLCYLEPSFLSISQLQQRPLMQSTLILSLLLFRFLYDLHRMAGRDNEFSSQNPARYPHHQFFEYMLREYLELRFVDSEFDCHYDEFREDGFIFAERDDLLTASEFTETSDMTALAALVEPVASTTGKT
ncbi:probable 4-hydroxy-2-oxoglutarate aldolase, mitochondrial [Aspergillus lentulus]|uniref:Probable 4-hydroxy-2-oxoglutarate aldolase, mitochondrial n=1 Tax=Aspergillus lentulus TaxID=293939 RepID=A0ABQ0ZWU4_ASPLE|nr:probable 4-hydroxy-2-oxoglutarate aldolase, mitochondrial [Aspergillus lentulus]GFG05513.1 probable 4-hydroxy-2-oxoglutarate aldolase, mitochondrial [Aspergillus lentulus]